MKSISFKFAGIFVALAFAVAAVPASALTQSQVDAVVNLVESFGADAATVANVRASLTGGTPVAGGGSTGSSSAACGPFNVDQTVGSTGAEPITLQTFL